MTGHIEYEDMPSDRSWVMVVEKSSSKTRKPQFKVCNRSSVEQAAATSGSSATSHSITDVHPSELEDNYDPSMHYPGSLETDATLRPADTVEVAPEPPVIEEPRLAPAHEISMEHLGPYLEQLPQHTYKDIPGWVAGAAALFVPYDRAQDSVRVEHGSADISSSASRSRAGLHKESVDVTMLGMGKWSGSIPYLGAPMSISISESSLYSSQFS